MTAPQTIAHYTLGPKLGEGGMGEVYRATDSRLGREVAIKVLPPAVACDPERLARFKREARVLASLNHPNIATIFGVEDEALVMELIEGDTLSDRIKRGAIPVEESVRIAQEIAAALEYAHQHGVVHRDLKPANVKAAERVKVLDFGLAKMQEVAGAGEDATITAATQAGTILGTAAYMSPEQASGLPVDARSDIFSFGVLLYEMLSGERAFSGHTPISTMGAIVHKEPKPLREIAPGVPAELDAVVARCMAKNPAHRFQSMPEVREALKKGPARAAAAGEEGPSLAVLPFANLSADKENEYFSDGLAEEILIALSQVKGLRAAARSSSFSFKGKQADPGEIAAKLNVGHILDGSVRRAGNRVRVTVQLVDARKCLSLWSERYDRQMEDIFAVQDEIARAIAAQLQVTLGGEVKQATQNVEAYELYLKGRHYLNQRIASTMRLAIQCFEQAIQLDQEFALAYGGLADCYAILRVYGYISHQAGQPPALAALEKAKTLEPNSWEVVFSQALYEFYFGDDWRASGAHFERAVALNPRSSMAHAYFGVYLAMERRREDALREAMTSCRLDPLSPFVHALAACTCHLIADHESGLPLAEKALELQPDFLFGLWILGLTQSSLDRHQEAIATLEKVLSISRAPIFVSLMSTAYARAGRAEDARRLLNELDERKQRGELIPPAVGSMTALCDYPGLRKVLEDAMAEHTPAFGILLLSPNTLNDFRDDPEIYRLLKQFLGY